MPRSNWKGYILFGWVSIPVTLYSTENKKAVIYFHQIDKRDNTRVKYQRINANTGKVVPWENVSRGYEYDKNKLIPVPDKILKKFAGEKEKTIEIQTFINKNEFDILAVEKNYYLVPAERGKGNKGYVILRESLKQTNKIGIARVILSKKAYIAAIIPHDNILLLCLMKYEEEIRKPTEFRIPDKPASYYKITQKEMEISKKLIKAMSSTWHPENYIDEYQAVIHRWAHEVIHQLPHAKIKHKKQAASSNVVNFIDLLKKSLAEKSKPSIKNKSTATHRKKKLKRERLLLQLPKFSYNMNIEFN